MRTSGCSHSSWPITPCPHVWMPTFASPDTLIQTIRLTTMNLSFPFLLAAVDAPFNQVPEMRSRCDWIMGPWVTTGLMSSSTQFSLISSILIDNVFSSSQAFVDSDGTLHAQLHVKLTQPKPMPPAPPVSPDQSDTWSQVPSVIGSSATNGSHSDTPRPTTSKSKSKGSRKVVDPNKPVYTSLRRGGR